MGVGFACLVDRGVLNEILLKAGIGGREGHGGGTVSVVHDIQRGQKETGAVPRAPLIVSIDRANAHVHGGAVGQRKG